MANFWDPVLRAFRWKDDTGEAHDRAHSMTSPLDHPPVPGTDFDKIPHTNETTGEWELIPTPTGTGTGNPIIIPQLKLHAKNTRLYDQKFPIRDTLMATWQSNNLAFLDHNPEIWIFRYNAYSQTKKSHGTYTGINLCPNPAFTDGTDFWEVGAGEIASGVFKLNEICTEGQVLLTNKMHFEKAKYYLIRFDVANYVSGAIRVRFAGNKSSTKLYVNHNGSFQGFIYVPPTAVSDQLEFISATTGHVVALDIDNIEVIDYPGQDWSKKINKKWKHEPHLNGIKYPAGAFYCGSIQSSCTEVQTSGRHTEFEFSNLAGSMYSAIPFNIPLDPWEYIFESNNTMTKLTDITAETVQAPYYAGSKSKIIFRFAIAIDNPDATSNNPKLIGPLSDDISMRLNMQAMQSQGYKRLAFEKDNRWRQPPR